ncbi:MAG: peptidase family protein, partial [Ilumatobacteraceae bacterium]|nr:peptidase family protein [Ilumatobacteraceae bacterium]
LALPGAFTPAVGPDQLRSAVLDDLAFDMLSTRLSDDRARGTATFADAYGDDDSIVRPLDAPSVVVTAEGDDVDGALDALLKEFERADRYGFSQAELDRSTASFRAGVVSRYDARDSTSDREFTENYVNYFLTGTPPLEAHAERTALTDVYDTVTPDEVAAAFSSRYHQSGSHLLVIAPDTMAAMLPEPQALLDTLAARPQLVVEPRADTAPVDDQLMARPEPVEELSSDEMADDPYSFLEPRLLTFPNGARVVLNPSDIIDDHVALAAVSPGGTSLVADADLPEALRALEVVADSGLGPLDPVQLDTMLSATSVQVDPYIDLTSERFSGSASTKDFETMLQVIAMYMTQPRFDQAALDSTIESWQPYVTDPAGDPDLAAYAAYSSIRFGDEPRFEVIPTAAELDGLDLPTVERVWRDRFSSPGDWTFAISGDFDLGEMTDLVRRYVGSLPGDGRAPEAAVDLQPAPPDGIVSQDVLAGSGQKSTLTRAYDAPVAADEIARATVLADLVTGVISNRLTDRVREEMGASYSPYGYSTVYTEPDRMVETIIEMTGDPARIDQLTALLGDELADLTENGPSAGEFDDALTALQQTYDEFDDESLVQVLAQAAADPTVLDDFIDRRDMLSDIDLSEVRSFIQRSLPADHYIQLRLLPA